MNDRNDFSELDRYLSGEGPPDERARIEQRAADDAELRALLTAMPAALRSEEAGWNTDRAWQQLAARMQPARITSPWRTRWIAIAAVLVIALGLAVSFRVWRATNAPSVLEYATVAGERRAVTLPDGSQVELAAASRLSVPAEYGIEQRTLALDGQAYFDVVADSTRPFIVLTRTARTRVLGTTFVVSEFSGDRAAELVVVSGRVEFGSKRVGQPTVVTPGQAARVSEDGAMVVRSDIDVNEQTAWREGRLVFRALPLNRVVPVLERWYDVEIEIADSTLASTRVTALFDRQSLDQVLDVLAETLGARYQRTGRTITFSR